MRKYVGLNVFRRFLCGLALMSFALAASMSQAADSASQGPDQLVDSVAKQLLSDLEANRAEYRKNPGEVRKLVDKYLLPHFDTEYAARLVLAKNWRTATPEQRKQFVDAFYQSLLNNYGNALLDFTADRMKILPFRGKTEDTNATIRTEIRRSNGQTVPVNYSLRKTPDGWKAWDVTIEGVSYVKSFRTDFGTEIEQKGLDAVIKRLQSNPYESPAATTGKK